MRRERTWDETAHDMSHDVAPTSQDCGRLSGFLACGRFGGEHASSPVREASHSYLARRLAKGLFLHKHQRLEGALSREKIFVFVVGRNARLPLAEHGI